MSHFAVLVVTPGKPTEGELERLLAPYHEFECTGWDNEYVQNVDRTDEARRDYEVDKAILVIKRPDESLEYAFDAQGDFKPEFRKFYSESERELQLPDGYERVNGLLAKDYVSFADWAAEHYDLNVINGDAAPDLDGKHKYGWLRVRDGEVVEVIDRTNPNAKWDWWTIGGRWSGFFSPGNGDKTGGNQVRYADLPIEELRTIAEQKAAKRWDAFNAARGDLPFPNWDALVKEHGVEKARDIYHADPAVRAVKEANALGFFEKPEQYLRPREEHLRHARETALETFAILKDGEWLERGEMGWWACVSNEKEPAEYSRSFAAVLDSLEPANWLTVVDCHI